MTRRPGLTLTEVLVTLAILAFGVLGILTLFPLAASQMAIAVREDRSAQAANAADGYFRSYWKSECVDKTRDGLPVNETFFTAMDDPDGGGPLPPAAADEPSYPVAVDPIGYVTRPGWVGDTSTKVARTSTQAVQSAPPALRNLYAFRLCSQMDGLGYDDNGHPTPDRELRYNWMWVLQRPQNGNKLTATMNVVVFDNRPQLYAPPGTEGVFDTAAPHVVPGSTSLNLVRTAGLLPNVKPGMWIMDVTDPTVGGNKIRHANFYQVVSMTPDATGNVVYLELQTPLKKSNDPAVPGTYAGRFVVLRGVTNVYPRPTLTAD